MLTVVQDHYHYPCSLILENASVIEHGGVTSDWPFACACSLCYIFIACADQYSQEYIIETKSVKQCVSL